MEFYYTIASIQFYYMRMRKWVLVSATSYYILHLNVKIPTDNKSRRDICFT